MVTTVLQCCSVCILVANYAANRWKSTQTLFFSFFFFSVFLSWLVTFFPFFPRVRCVWKGRLPGLLIFFSFSIASTFFWEQLVLLWKVTVCTRHDSAETRRTSDYYYCNSTEDWMQIQNQQTVKLHPQGLIKELEEIFSLYKCLAYGYQHYALVSLTTPIHSAEF